MSIPTEPEPNKAAYCVPRLPAELWLLIFRFATLAHTSPQTSAPYNYDAFQPCPDTAAALSDAALRDKCVLMLVCKQWRALALDLLYEDIRIGTGHSALRAALCEPPTVVEGDDGAVLGYAPRHRVRRAVLPYAYTATPTCDPPPALALLDLLQNLEVLVRPPYKSHHPYQQHHYDFYDLFDHDGFHFRPIHSCISPILTPAPRFEFSTATPAFPTLRRLEWAFDSTGDAARTGGINALDDVLRAAPSLCELVLVGSMPLAAIRQSPRQQLRTLHTLRLHGGAAACPFVARQTTYWVLPALENVVVTGAADVEALEALWEAHGSQVRVLEAQLGGTRVGVASGCGALLSMTGVGKIANACPKLEELNVRLSAEDFEDSAWDSPEGDGVGIPWTWACAHDTLQRVGICIDAGEWTAKTWLAVIEQVAQLAKGCPALRCVTLHVPDVGVAEENQQFQALRGTLMSGGRQLLVRSVHAWG